MGEESGPLSPSKRHDIHWARDCERAVRILEAQPDGMTLTAVAHQGGWPGTRAKHLLDDLGAVVRTKFVRRNGEKFLFYYLDVPRSR